MPGNAFADGAIGSALPLPASRPKNRLGTPQAIAAVVALLVLIPLLLLICAAIYLQDGGPVLFRQKRIGKGGKTFDCLKFRTMSQDAEARLAALLARDAEARAEWERDHKLRDDPRVTPLGRLLRKSSLDELPQLVNIMRGEMSLVGPRPIVAAEIPRYGWRIRHYYAVKPGLTGLWQVSGRNDISYRRRVAMDTLYARRKDILLDCWLVVLTFPAVLVRRGSY